MKGLSAIVTEKASCFHQPLICLRGIGKMKKFFLFILVLLMLLIPAGEILAQRAVVISSTLNVRSGPGKKHEVIDKLKKGDSYLIEKIEGSWVQLAWPVEAWVYKGLVKIEKSSASFEQLQIDFQNWLLDKYYRIRSIEFKSDWQIWLKLREYPSVKTLRKMAREIAVEYKKQTGYSKRPVVVTIFWKNRPYVTAKY
jgi:uncharacterized protein YgiM (DUF1202 family)